MHQFDKVRVALWTKHTARNQGIHWSHFLPQTLPAGKARDWGAQAGPRRLVGESGGKRYPPGAGQGAGRGAEAGARTHAANALTQQRDMLRKELALARVPRAASMPRSRSLVLKMRSIWRGTWLRSWLIWGR